MIVNPLESVLSRHATIVDWKSVHALEGIRGDRVTDVNKWIEYVGSLNPTVRHIIPRPHYGMQAIANSSVDGSTEKASRKELEWALKELYARVREHEPDLPNEFSNLIQYLELTAERSSPGNFETSYHGIKG